MKLLNSLLKVVSILSLLIITFSVFYYFAYRPITKDRLREKCAKEIMKQNGNGLSDTAIEAIDICVDTNFINW